MMFGSSGQFECRIRRHPTVVFQIELFPSMNSNKTLRIKKQEDMELARIMKVHAPIRHQTFSDSQKKLSLLNYVSSRSLQLGQMCGNSGRTSAPCRLGNNKPAIPASASDTGYIRSTFPYGNRVHNCSYIFLDSLLYCIPYNRPLTTIDKLFRFKLTPLDPFGCCQLKESIRS
jgi:hypothetical protein